MREQLPKPLRIASLLPYWVHFLICITFFIVGAVNTSIVTVIFYMFSFLSFVAAVLALVAKEMMTKMRFGVNPLYIVRKNPKNLDAQINDLLRERFKLISRTETAASLERKPVFDWLIFIILALLGLFPALVYAVWLGTRKPDQVLLDITSQ